MNFELEANWQKILTFFAPDHGDLDVPSVLFLIGIQELGKGAIALSKDKKVEVMHIGVCTVLAPYGYYNFLGLDKEGWPHFENVETLPKLDSNEQKDILKEAIVAYFESEKII
ncbi:MAG: hypothetical protein HON99_01980 [Crocinitomicaceae bacterium]|nr:hypothetical protein [Crocinitomicaceae bacterium]